MIELLLVKDVPHLGKRGTTVQVKKGFARNHLLPLNLAVHVTPDNLKMVDKARVKWLAEEAKLLEEMRELATHVEKLSVRIVAKASETGSLYGSVTDRDIAKACADQGVAIELSAVKLEAPVKVVGDYTIPIFLHEEVQVSIPLAVRAEGREDWLPGEEEEKGEYVSSEEEEDSPTPDA